MDADLRIVVEGRGSRLIQGVLDDVRARGLRVLPVCPFVLAFLERHPEHELLVWKPPAEEAAS
jgi:predicted GNAT family acetyltransferase